ncbi:glycoside hydrolase family 16 protein [Thermophagus sp. OGC60D27]|uniref:glycoside hydrolase family 16 protein n=1 Tax=Thermophagus sp. OGC60D27 TaxID=3458415 RepID=UPI0040382B5B
MAGILNILFGRKFPDTQKYEDRQNQLRSDFARYLEIENSSLYQRFQELDRIIHSGEFEKKVEDLKRKKFKDTPEYQKLRRFRELEKDRDIRTYLKVFSSGKGKKMEEIRSSSSFSRFRELQSYINTPEFYKEKSSPEFKKSEAYQQYKEYKKLRKNKEIKWAKKYEKTGSYQTFQKMEGSDRLSEYYELKALTESDKFKDFKAFMEDRRRFEKSEEATLIKEFESMKKNKDIVWYQSQKEKHPFEDLKKWKLTFEDNFDEPTLDTKKWITGYYWGKALMNDSYSLEGEEQYYTPSNIEVRDSMLRIVTRKENVEGKVWSPKWGFQKKAYNYTSGLISTGQSFRQRYGRFEAKVRFNKAYPFIHAFWMVGEKMVPHVDIFKSMYPGGRLLEAGVISEVDRKKINESTKRINGTRFTNDFYIYTLDWSEKEMIWRVNGVVVNRQTQNIPHEPMYLTFCTLLTEDPEEKELPGILEISWVRCYQRV